MDYKQQIESQTNRMDSNKWRIKTRHRQNFIFREKKTIICTQKFASLIVTYKILTIHTYTHKWTLRWYIKACHESPIRLVCKTREENRIQRGHTNSAPFTKARPLRLSSSRHQPRERGVYPMRDNRVYQLRDMSILFSCTKQFTVFGDF